MSNYAPIPVTIYVRRKRIMRNGQFVQGWQAGFQRGSGGVTSASHDDAVELQRQVAKRMGVGVAAVIEENFGTHATETEGAPASGRQKRGIEMTNNVHRVVITDLAAEIERLKAALAESEKRAENLQLQVDSIDDLPVPDDTFELWDKQIASLTQERDALNAGILNAHGILPAGWVFTDWQTTLDLLVAEITTTRAERDAAQARAEKAEADNKTFRCLLWAAHSQGRGYGDDGEMQFRGIDFKRMSAEEIEAQIERSNLQALKDAAIAKERP